MVIELYILKLCENVSSAQFFRSLYYLMPMHSHNLGRYKLNFWHDLLLYIFFSFAQRCTEVGVAQLGLKYLLVAQVKYLLAIA